MNKPNTNKEMKIQEKQLSESSEIKFKILGKIGGDTTLPEDEPEITYVLDCDVKNPQSRYILSNGELYIQTASYARRDPDTRMPLPSIPIYVKRCASDVNPCTRLLPTEEAVISDFSNGIAHLYKKFADTVKASKQTKDLYK